MSNSVYAALTRQSGLWQEMQSVANNIANSSTTGFRSEGLVFAEYIRSTGPENPSISMATAGAHATDYTQGVLSETGGTFDFAVEGEGFFQIETPAGLRLTRAGSFTPTPAGQLVTPDGYPLLDQGGAPVFVPGNAASISVAPDGTMSADGVPVAQIGLFIPAEGAEIRREDGVRFQVDGPLNPADQASVLQGFLEGSNVDPVAQVARMIEVQRAYEMGQSFLEKEDERLRSIMTLMRN
ncbi:MAG: flagellar hook-basal body complex protein [Pseudomonadota bacterium]